MIIDIKELKEKILANNLEEITTLIFKDEVGFISKQYINKIAELKNLSIHYIENYRDAMIDSFITNYLYVLDIDELDETIPQIKNLIVVTKKINKNLEINHIEVPKLEEWMLRDYLKLYLNGLTDAEIDYIFNLTKKDAYLLTNEMNKISVFTKTNQSLIFNNLSEENNYSYLFNINSFDLSNAIMKKDKDKIKGILSKSNSSDINIFQLISLLHNNFIKLSEVQMNPKASADSLSITYKQFLAIKYNVNKYSNIQIMRNIEFLDSIDRRLKTGDLDIADKDMLNYVVCNLILD